MKFIKGQNRTQSFLFPVSLEQSIAQDNEVRVIDLYILTKKEIECASADVGFMFIAYNLRRIINILGQDMLKKYLSILVCYILSIFVQIRLILKRSAECIFFKYICKLNFDYCLNRLIFEQNFNKSRGF